MVCVWGGVSQTYKQTKDSKIPRHMVKAKLNRQEHPKTDTLTKREKREGEMIKTGTKKEAINQPNKQTHMRMNTKN